MAFRAETSVEEVGFGVGITGVVGCGVGIVGADDVSTMYFARDTGPKVPVAGLIPFAVCHFCTAATVFA